MSKTITLNQYLSQNYPNSDKEALLNDVLKFLLDNKWFGIKYATVQDGDRSYVQLEESQLHKIAPRINLFLQHRNDSTEEKIESLTKMLEHLYPGTAAVFKKYIRNLDDDNSEEMIHAMLNYLIKFLNKELAEYTNEELTEMYQNMCETATYYLELMLAGFFKYNKRSSKVNYTVDFEPEHINRGTMTKEAYSEKLMSELAYYLFNPQYISEHELLQRACESYDTANAWLYLALHFVCAWRDTDLQKNMPHPLMKYSPEETLLRIKNKEISTQEAYLAAESIRDNVYAYKRKPNKTSRYGNVPSLVLAIPESVKPLFGILFLLCEAHWLMTDKKKSYITPVKSNDKLARYLTDDIADVFGEEDFSVRSANKALLQGLEYAADHAFSEDNSLHVRGYMLAALARSHKGEFGGFAKTTQLYLKDAKFKGYSPKFVARELMERGVCGFIGAMLLEILQGEKFVRLNPSEQTKMITDIGLSPYEIENSMCLIEQNSIDASTAVRMILQQETSEDRHKVVHNLLYEIAAGNAVSKTVNSYCLLSASDIPCQHYENNCCIGCQYEIKTMSSIFLLLNEYERNLDVTKTTQHPLTKAKHQYIVETRIVPSITEILSTIKQMYGDEEYKYYCSIVKEYINDL